MVEASGCAFVPLSLTILVVDILDVRNRLEWSRCRSHILSIVELGHARISVLLTVSLLLLVTRIQNILQHSLLALAVRGNDQICCLASTELALQVAQFSVQKLHLRGNFVQSIAVEGMVAVSGVAIVSV